MNNQIRVMREELDMTQTELARRAGLSRVTVNRVERGMTLPDGRTILRLAEALSATAAEVFPALATKEAIA